MAEFSSEVRSVISSFPWQCDFQTCLAV